MNGIDDATVKDLSRVISYTIIPALLLIADAHNYDRDSFIKFATAIMCTMADSSTFKHFKL